MPDADRARRRTENELQHGRLLLSEGAESTWGWGTPAGRRRAERRAAWLIAAAGLRPGMRALELGCGTGFFTERFAATGADLTAIDLSPEMIGVASRRGLPGNVRLTVSALESFEAPAPFDAVIGSSVLHHLEIRPALTTLHGLLRPGGSMAFAEPNMLNPQIAVQKNVPWVKARAGDSPDETAFVRWPLAAVLAEAGFVAVDVSPTDWLHPATPTSAIRIVEALGSALERTPVLREFAGSLHIRATRPR